MFFDTRQWLFLMKGEHVYGELAHIVTPTTHGSTVLTPYKDQRMGVRLVHQLVGEPLTI